MRKKIVDLFTVLVPILATFQLLIPIIPNIGEQSITVVSAITLFLVSGLTTWKQTLSVEIADKALIATLSVAALATLGGAIDLLKIIPFSDVTAQWVRFTLTLFTALINIFSKIIWPTTKTQSLI